jgi:uncharacterized protein (TIGR02147 family)
VSIFNFSDYRRFLREQLEKISNGKRGQVVALAAHLRVNSTLVSQVFSGLKDFTTEQAADIADYLGLTPLESEYFILLVQIERAGTARLKSHFKSRLAEIKASSKKIDQRVEKDRALSEQEKAVFYSSWIYSAIRLYCSLSDEGQTLERISEQFDLSRAKASELVRFLVGAGLCEKKHEAYFMRAQRTVLENNSPFSVRHHTNWRLKALQKADSLSEAEFMFSAPFSISHEDLAQFRESLLVLIKELYARVKDSKAETLACFNVDLVKLIE